MYGLLHYPGDLTGDVVPGQLCGWDEAMRPFAVIDAEYQPEVDTTTVFLQYATPEQIKVALGGAA